MQQELDDILDGDVLTVLLLVAVTFALAAYDWWRQATATPPQPVFMTALFVAACVYAAYRMVVVRPRISQLKLGRDGEKAVAQYLEAHRESEWRLFNDIPGDGFNVDHILLSPQGVFVLETKTHSKGPKGQESKVTYDGKKVLVNGHAPDRDPVVQANAIAAWVRDALKETTGRRAPVRPVVLYPGWWVEQSGNWAQPEVWVLNLKALPKLIAHRPAVLSPEEIALYADALTYRITRE